MLTQLLKELLYKKGYKVIKINPNPILHENYLVAIKPEIKDNAVLFDVGANQGQTITKFKSHFPKATIHSFEPSRSCFDLLKKNHSKTNNTTLINKAIGKENGVLEFNEYEWSSLNSLLKRSFTKSKILTTYAVDIITIDDYCVANQVDKIHLLKTDTEGYELNVLKGANQMLSSNRVKFIYSEIFFYENYIGQSSFGDIYNFLTTKGFDLIRFYTFEYTESGLASRTDALFINRNFRD